MKLLFLGEIGVGQTSLMRMRAFARMGHEVRGVNTIELWKQASWLQRRVQRKLQRGPVVDEINRAVLQAARDFRPDIIWGEKQEYLRADTIRTLRAQGARLVHFTPDPYFSLYWKRTRLMDAAMGEFDMLVYCKRYEQAEYGSNGQSDSQVTKASDIPVGDCIVVILARCRPTTAVTQAGRRESDAE